MRDNAIRPVEFKDWLISNNIHYDEVKQIIHFVDSEFLFRIPIGDYRLQLDHHIKAALALLPPEGDLLVARRDLRWSSFPSHRGPLNTVLRMIRTLPNGGALRFADHERDMVFVLTYLTNRWGNSNDSLYIMAEVDPNIMIYVPGSTESIFVFNRTLGIHDDNVRVLKEKRVPAYGGHVKSPMKAPVYDDIPLGSSVVTVDRTTGKPYGPGSEESVLFREYLPPD